VQIISTDTDYNCSNNQSDYAYSHYIGIALLSTLRSALGGSSAIIFTTDGIASPDYPLFGSFIHSFILNIYIAPLQENYSEVLQTPAWLKRAVLRWEKTQVTRL